MTLHRRHHPRQCDHFAIYLGRCLECGDRPAWPELERMFPTNADILRVPSV